MHSRMEEQMKEQQGFKPQTSPSNPEPKKKAGDYIDFEEVRTPWPQAPVSEGDLGNRYFITFYDSLKHFLVSCQAWYNANNFPTKKRLYVFVG